jgi:exodeoxyribonuclease VIII
MSLKPESPEAVGIWRNLSYDEYEDLAGLRKSRLWTLNERTPAHWQYELAHPEERDSDALRRGRAVHVAVLEPNAFDKLYWPEPDPPEGGWNKRLKAHRELWATHEAEAANKGAVLLAEGELDKCRAMRDAVREHPAAADLLASAEVEISMQWVDVETGMLLKGRMDGWCERGGIIFDLKSCENAAPGPFGRQAYRYGYHFQAALYVDGAQAATETEVRDFVLIAGESAPPYCVACYEVEGQELQLGRDQYKSILRAVAACRKAGCWPGYNQGLMSLVLPAYAGCEFVGYSLEELEPAAQDGGNSLGF